MMKKEEIVENGKLKMENEKQFSTVNAQLSIKKKGWEIKKLGEVCDIRSGRNQKTVLNPDGKYPILGSAGKVMGYADDYLCEEGTTIIGRKGTIDKPLYIKSKFWNVDTAFGLIARDSLDKKYLFYFCRSFNFKKLDKGTTLPSLIKKDLIQIEIPIPPLKTQQQIVALLDKAFTAIDQAKANAQQNLINAKQLFESYLQNVFENKGDDWVEKSLGDVVDFFNGFAFKSKDAIEYSNTQVIRMGNLYKNRLNLDRKSVFYPEEFAQEFKKYLLIENDLIISLTGTTGKEDYGYTVKIPKTERKLLLNQRIAKFIIKDESIILRDLLFRFLLSRTFLDELYKTANGTRQANLSTETMKGLSISFPKSIKEQQQIVKKLNNLSAQTKKSENIYSQKIADLEELKKSILQKAFSGQLSELG